MQSNLSNLDIADAQCDKASSLFGMGRGRAGGVVKSVCEPSDPFGRRLSPFSVA